MKSRQETPSTSRTDEEAIPEWGPGQPPPGDEPRCEDVHEISLGDVVQDDEGRNWVFYGWRQNSAGGSAYFVMEEKGYRKGDPITYSAAFASTLERKFPTLSGRRRA